MINSGTTLWYVKQKTNNTTSYILYYTTWCTRVCYILVTANSVFFLRHILSGENVICIHETKIPSSLSNTARIFVVEAMQRYAMFVYDKMCDDSSSAGILRRTHPSFFSSVSYAGIRIVMRNFAMLVVICFSKRARVRASLRQIDRTGRREPRKKILKWPKNVNCTCLLAMAYVIEWC